MATSDKPKPVSKNAKKSTTKKVAPKNASVAKTSQKP